jgi:multidrug efflux system outer membrane protein
MEYSMIERATYRRSTLLLAALLSACSLTPPLEIPAAPVSATYPGQSASATASGQMPAWDHFIADERLRGLIRLALQNNRDLRVASLNIEQVRAQYQVRQADELPTLNAVASANRQPTASGGMSSVYTAGLAMSGWEIDFFGRLSSLKDAALAQFFASEEAQRSAQTSLVASVASTWLSLQTNEVLLALTKRTLVTREESLRLSKLRFDAGATSALDLRQAESLTAAARNTLAQQQRAKAQDINALTLLVGQPLPANLLPDATVMAPFQAVPEGLPSELLVRRADIRQAEQAMVAANANIGAARAAFFPRIALTTSFGTVSNQLSGLLKDGSWGFSLAPQAMLPIFDLGRNQANLELAKVARATAVAQYEKSIQIAFREVADALIGRATLSEQLKAQEQQVQAETERYRLAELRYRNGVSSYMDVLDAQRSLFATQQARAQSRLAQLQNQVVLYKALGGGY